MRLRGKVDRNQVEIVRALRQIGCSVQSLGDVGEGCPDLLVGFRGRNILYEIKDGMLPPSKKRLTLAESDWHSLWLGQVAVIESIRDALKILDW